MKNNFGEQEPVLCVPPSKIDIFLDQYHTSLLGGHSGISKCYQTLRQRIYCPNLPYYVRLYVVPPQSWGDRSDTKHSKCLLLGGRRLNQLTLIPKPKGSGGAWAATAQVGPANKRNDTKRCLPVEASLRPGEAVPW